MSGNVESRVAKVPLAMADQGVRGAAVARGSSRGDCSARSRKLQAVGCVLSFVVVDLPGRCFGEPCGLGGGAARARCVMPVTMFQRTELGTALFGGFEVRTTQARGMSERGRNVERVSV